MFFTPSLSTLALDMVLIQQFLYIFSSSPPLLAPANEEGMRPGQLSDNWRARPPNWKKTGRETGVCPHHGDSIKGHPWYPSDHHSTIVSVYLIGALIGLPLCRGKTVSRTAGLNSPSLARGPSRKVVVCCTSFVSCPLPAMKCGACLHPGWENNTDQT